MKKLTILATAVTAMIGLNQTANAASQQGCVFDLVGTSGESYQFMKDYALQAKKWGADLDLKVYTDERVAAEDFKAGKCDLVAITGIRGRQFNKFAGSIDAIGATPDSKTAMSIVKLMASSNSKIAKKMVNGKYEIAGILPVGNAYILVNDRSINTLSKAAGKKVAVLDHDKSQAKLVQGIGAQPVSSDVTTFGSKFNNGEVDVIAAPAMAFKPLELHKGLGSKGAIINFPIAQITGNVIINKSKFPAGYGAKSRKYVASKVGGVFNDIKKQERAIPKKYWMNIPSADKPDYIKTMRDARIALTKDGYYDRSMMSLLKKLRCKSDASAAECSMSGE